MCVGNKWDFPYIQIHASMQASFMDNVIVALQVFAILNISNAMEEVLGKQVTTGITNNHRYWETQDFMVYECKEKQPETKTEAYPWVR